MEILLLAHDVARAALSRYGRWSPQDVEDATQEAALHIWRAQWSVAQHGGAGRALAAYDAEVDPAAFGQGLYAAWQQLAAEELPAKLAYLGVTGVDYPVLAAPAWMRPGVALHQKRKRELLALYAEMEG